MEDVPCPPDPPLQHLFNLEERDSDAELEAEEQRLTSPPAEPPPPRLQLPPDVVPREHGSAPQLLRPALSPGPSMVPLPSARRVWGRTGDGKLVLLTPTQSPVRPRAQQMPGAQVPNISFWTRPQVMLRPQAALAPVSSLGAQVRVLEARAREVEALEARVREAEQQAEQAVRSRELREWEASLKEREASLRLREEEARRQLARVQGGEARVQGGEARQACGSAPPCQPLPRPIVLPSRFRLPDSARRISLPLPGPTPLASGEDEAPMDLSAAHRDHNRSRTPASLTSSVETLAFSPVAQTPSQPTVLQRVASSINPPTIRSPPTPLVEISCSNLTEMLGVSPLAGSTPQSGGDQHPGLAGPLEKVVQGIKPLGPEDMVTDGKGKQEEEQGTSRQEQEQVQETPRQEEEQVQGTPRQEEEEQKVVLAELEQEQDKLAQANVAVPYLSALESGCLLEGEAGLEELLEREGGGVLTLLATEGPDGSLTLTSPPLEQDGGPGVAGRGQVLGVQHLEEEFGLLQSQLKDINGGEKDVVKAAQKKCGRTRTTSTVMAEICSESSIDTLEKQIEEPEVGGDLVEDFGKRLEEVERSEGLELGAGDVSAVSDAMEESVLEPEAVKLSVRESSDELQVKLHKILVKSPSHGWTNFKDEENICKVDDKAAEVDNLVDSVNEAVQSSVVGDLVIEATKEVQSAKEIRCVKRKYATQESIQEIPGLNKKICLDAGPANALRTRKGSRRNNVAQTEQVLRKNNEIVERRSNRLKSREKEEKFNPDLVEKSPLISKALRDPEIQKKSNSLDGKTNPKEKTKKVAKTQRVDIERLEIGEKYMIPKSSDPKPVMLPATPKLPAPVRLQCGKCFSVSRSCRSWTLHQAKVHGGLARLVGECQEFRPEEEAAAVGLAYQSCKRVPCGRCGKVTFTDPGLLLYHLRQCGVKEETEEVKVEIGGRSRRAAATKAKGRVAEFVKQITKKYDGESSEEGSASEKDISNDEDSDDNFDIGKETGAPSLYTVTLEGRKRYYFIWRHFLFLNSMYFSIGDGLALYVRRLSPPRRQLRVT